MFCTSIPKAWLAAVEQIHPHTQQLDRGMVVHDVVVWWWIDDDDGIMGCEWWMSLVKDVLLLLLRLKRVIVIVLRTSLINLMEQNNRVWTGYYVVGTSVHIPCH